jgi:HTH-type transcriptional regulator / antitoxin HipB
MTTRESRASHGRRRGEQLQRRVLSELREARMVRGVTQTRVARELGMSQPQLWRIENSTRRADLVRLSELAAVLGYELAVTLHPVGDAIRDKGHQALLKRFRAVLGDAWRVATEVPFPNAGDARSWDMLLRSGTQRVGVEAETRVRDVQALVRRMRGREQAGGADAIVLVLSDSAHNRRLAPELRLALGWPTSPRALLRALRSGEQLPGSGVVLV